ncbi:MAG: DUF3592 domain-containing protein [Chitinophagales bacterium]|nr:DUF3592 domain-containing protein [Sphingobacteriales bacterium]
MTSLENIIHQKLTLKVFLLVSFFVISIPILSNFNYLLFGEKVNGVVTGNYTMEGRRSNYTVSQIDYRVAKNIYSFFGPKNLVFDDGEIVEIYYIKDNPQNAALASPIYFYFNSSGINIICSIFMIFWIAVFFTYGIRYR